MYWSYGSEVLGSKGNKFCPVCGGTGVVNYWSEYLTLDDRRCCSDCESGRALGERIGRIVQRMTSEQQSDEIKRYSLFAIP